MTIQNHETFKNMENYLFLKTGVEPDDKRMSTYEGKSILFGHDKMDAFAPDNSLLL
jgi:hypothetical protein